MSLAPPRQVRDLGDDLLHEVGIADLDALGRRTARLSLSMMAISCSMRARVVRANLGAEAVLERRDDAPAIGVVLRVGAGHDEDIQRQANLVAANLHVALFHDVEQADLDALGEVGQLVDAEDAAIGARHQAVVDGQLVGEVAPLGDLDRVHLADQVGDGDVRRGQLLAVAPVARDPVDRRVVALLGDARLARLADAARTGRR